MTDHTVTHIGRSTRQDGPDWTPKERAMDERKSLTAIQQLMLHIECDLHEPDLGDLHDEVTALTAERDAAQSMERTAVECAEQANIALEEAIAERDALAARVKVLEGEWRDPNEVPYDTLVTVRVGGMTFGAILRCDASMNEAGYDCDQWQATVDGEHPPCWTDGACWESNSNGMASRPPEGWQALTEGAES